jgi:hypothetical protein
MTPTPKWEKIDFVRLVKEADYIEKTINLAANSQRTKNLYKVFELNKVIGVEGLDLL